MLETLKGTNTKVVRTTLTSVMVLFAYYAVSPFITPFLISRGFVKDEISYASAFAPFLLIFLSAIIGQISDVIGRKRTISISLLLMVTSYLLYLNIHKNIFILILAAGTLAIAYEAFVNTSISRIEDNVDENTRGKSTGTYETFRSVGILFGSLFGTLIVARLGIPAILKVSLYIIGAVFLISFFFKSHKHNRIPLTSLNFVKEIRSFLSIRGLPGAAILGMAGNFAAAANSIFIPLLITQELHANLSYVGIYVAILSGAHLTQYFWGKTCDIHGNSKIIIIAALSVALSYILLMFASSPIYVLFCGALIGLSGAAWNVSMLCYMSKIGEKHKSEGLVMGSYSSLSYIGIMLGYVLSGYLSVAVSTRAVFLMYGLVGLAAVAIAKKLITE